jgi:hypothetical protein
MPLTNLHPQSAITQVQYESLRFEWIKHIEGSEEEGQ